MINLLSNTFHPLKPQAKIENYQTVKFVDPKLIKCGTILVEQLIPKIINLSNDEDIIQQWRNRFNFFNPMILNYRSEEEFLNNRNLTKDIIVENSILYAEPNIQVDDLTDMQELFLPLIDNFII